MIYSSIVLDNSTYFTTGTIRVRIFSYYLGPRFEVKDDKRTPIAIDDLSSKPDLISEGLWTDPETGATGEGINKPHQDFDCWIYAPFGGGRNYGMFHLPQVNERGIVSFLDGDKNKPVWMGSYFQPIADPDKYPAYEVKEINAPTDDVTGDSNGVFFKGANKTGMYGDPNAVVIRTKHTELTKKGQSYDANDLAWQTHPSENLIVLGSDQMRLRRFDKIENGELKKFQDVLINRTKEKDKDGDSKPIIQLEVNNIDKDRRGVLTLTEEGFTIFLHSTAGDVIFNVSASGDTGINLQDQFGNKIIGDKDGLQLDTTANANSKIIIIADKETNIMGDADNFVRYSYLKNVIEKFESHVHITAGPSGPTSAAMDSNGAPGIGTVITSDKNDMKASNVKTD